MLPAGDFLSFCERRGVVALPATDETVAGYLADAGLKAATIVRRLVVISHAHRAADLPSPTTSSLVRRTHAGIRRAIGTAQAASTDMVRRYIREANLFAVDSAASLAGL